MSKNVTLSCYNFDIHESILIIFGRNVTEKVSNQKATLFPIQNFNYGTTFMYDLNDQVR